MNRNKLNIRTDLLRVTKMALDVGNPFEKGLANTFLNKAKKELEESFPNEKRLEKEIEDYQKKIDSIAIDPLERIRWGEKVLTISSRLGVE
jgi:peptidoglycan hydrolase CwlO-like protein